jgi:hypothetical protein
MAGTRRCRGRRQPQSKHNAASSIGETLGLLLGGEERQQSETSRARVFGTEPVRETNVTVS